MKRKDVRWMPYTYDFWRVLMAFTGHILDEGCKKDASHIQIFQNPKY